MKALKPKDASKILGVTVGTLQKWDREGTLPAQRLKTNRRYYTIEQLNEFMGVEEPANAGKVVIYARVSNHGQSDDLQSQVDFLKSFAKQNNYEVSDVIVDIGSGLNYDRKKWNKLVEDVVAGNVTKIIVTHKDRFIRFGFTWFERFLKAYGCTLEVVNNEKLSPPEEVVQDLISIIDTFSSRVHGLRKYKDKIKQDDELLISSAIDLFNQDVTQDLLKEVADESLQS